MLLSRFCGTFLAFVGLIEKYGTNRESVTLQGPNDISVALQLTGGDEKAGFAAAHQLIRQGKVRSCFLVFVPTIREIRDFYREV
eukprot:SAG31_NODE_12241_length_956_cov_1.211202_1_plen_84_part_00